MTKPKFELNHTYLVKTSGGSIHKIVIVDVSVKCYQVQWETNAIAKCWYTIKDFEMGYSIVEDIPKPNFGETNLEEETIEQIKKWVKEITDLEKDEVMSIDDLWEEHNKILHEEMSKEMDSELSKIIQQFNKTEENLDNELDGIIIKIPIEKWIHNLTKNKEWMLEPKNPLVRYYMTHQLPKHSNITT